MLSSEQDYWHVVISKDWFQNGARSFIVAKKKRFRMETHLVRCNYALAASTTIVSSFSIDLSKPSMPLFNVNVEEGHPLQAP